MTREEKIEEQLIDLLWAYMKRDPQNKDRVQTGYGTKTKDGLVASVRRIVDEEGV